MKRNEFEASYVTQAGKRNESQWFRGMLGIHLSISPKK